MASDQIFTMSNDEKVTAVNSNLKFLSRIHVGEKINIRDLFVRDNDSFVQRAIRTFRNVTTYISMSESVESKSATLEYIKFTINDAIALISYYRKDKTNALHQHIANSIVKDLESSKAGIRNLLCTYQNDRRFIAEAEATIQSLEARIWNLKKGGLMDGFTDISFIPPKEPDPAIVYEPEPDESQDTKKDAQPDREEQKNV